MEKDSSPTVSKKASSNPFEVKQALVGLELGDTDEIVLKYFDFMSKKIPVAASYFIHVMGPFSALDALFEKETQSVVGDYSIHEDVESKLIKEVEKRITGLADMYTEYQIIEGNALDEIIRTCEETKADLVVIGQNSEVDYHGILAKNLVRKTHSNALIIPSRSNCTLNTILVPIDFSPNSVRALQTAVAINRQLEEKAKIICLNVYEMPNASSFRFSRTWDEYQRIVESNIEGAFDAFLNTYGAEDLDHIERVLLQKEGPGIGKAIMNLAKENAIDFIVMGAKGHSKVHLLLMGSVTEKLMSLNKSIPTLIVK